MKMYRFALLCLVLLMGSVSATVVKQCKKNRPLPISVDVVGCDTATCTVYKGATAVMKVHFLGTRDNIQSIKTVVHATTLGITVPYALPEDVADVCSNLLDGAICPIDNTEDNTYNFNFYVDNSYPEIGVKVEVDLVDEYKESVACFTVDIKVRKGAATQFLNNSEVDALE